MWIFRLFRVNRFYELQVCFRLIHSLLIKLDHFSEVIKHHCLLVCFVPTSIKSPVSVSKVLPSLSKAQNGSIRSWSYHVCACELIMLVIICHKDHWGSTQDEVSDLHVIPTNSTLLFRTTFPAAPTVLLKKLKTKRTKDVNEKKWRIRGREARRQILFLYMSPHFISINYLTSHWGYNSVLELMNKTSGAKFKWFHVWLELVILLC